MNIRQSLFLAAIGLVLCLVGCSWIHYESPALDFYPVMMVGLGSFAFAIGIYDYL